MPTPGQIAANSTVPFGGRTLDQATWVTGSAQKLLNGIINQAYQLGDASMVGMPASWPYGPIQNEDILAGGKASPILEAKVQQYVNSQAAQSDPDFNSWVGVPYSSAAPGGWIDEPLSVSEQIALRNQALNEQKALLSMVGSPRSSTPSSSPSVRISTSSGGSSSSGTNYGERLGYEKQSGALDLELLAQKNALNLQYQSALQALKNDPNNPEIAIAKAELEERIRQFNLSLALQEKAQGIDRGKVVADYSANPGDMVARQYFLNQGVMPKGQAVDIFTGQQVGTTPMSFDEIMQHNAPAVATSLGGTGQPEEETPQFARGTRPTPPQGFMQHPMAQKRAFGGADPQLTSDGWTRADSFIAGDPQRGMMANPERIDLRVRNGQPEARVKPLSPQALMKSQRPKFAGGTSEWDWLGVDWNQADDYDAFGQNIYDYSQPIQSPGFMGVAPTQALAYTQPSQTSYTPDLSQPYVLDKNSGTVAQIGATGFINDDPYYGTPYAGMSPTDLVTNGNSAYYGMTVEAAAAAQANADRAPAGYVVGPVTGASQWGYAPANVAVEGYRTDGAVVGGGDPGPYVNVQNQGEAGILTGAQISQGQTQSQNPTQPNYVSPFVQQYGIPGQTPTPPPQIDSNQDGLDDANGVAMGVVADASSPSGFSYNGQPVTANGAPYTQDGAAGGPDLAGEPQMPATPEEMQKGVLEGKSYLQGQDGQWYEQPQSAPAQTTAAAQGQPQAPGMVTTAGQVKSPDGGATYNLLPGDVPAPDGFGYLRYDPIRMDYVPIMPNYTQIATREQFFDLPPETQQAILTGQKTGYVLNPDVVLFPDQGQSKMLSEEEFRALTPQQQRALLEGTEGVTEGFQPESQLAYDSTGPLMSFPTGGAVYGGQPFDLYHDYAQYLTPDELASLYAEGDPTPTPTVLPPWLANPITTPYPWGTGSTLPDGWQYLKRPQSIMFYTNQTGAQIPYTDPDYGRFLVSPTGEVFYSESGASWGPYGGNLPDNLRDALGGDMEPISAAPIPPPGTPAPEGGTGTAGTGGTGGTGTGGTGTAGTGGTGAGTGGTGAGTGGTGAGTGGTGTGTGGTGTGGTGGTGTGGTGGTGNTPLSPEQILALIYGSDVYQNIPALRFLSGDLSGGDYANITNQEVEVPGLGISLPSPAQAMNYGMLLDLMNSGGFEALDSLYTSANIPLSMIAQIAKARAPLGQAFDPSLVTS